MKKMLLVSLLAAALPLVAAGCDDSDEEVVVYRALLMQVNPQASAGAPSASLQVAVQGDDIIEVDLNAFGLDAVDHPTFLRTGSSCPTSSSDANGDGFVDIAEGRTTYGDILLPLDADITTQTIDPGTFPSGSTPQYSAIERLQDVLAAVSGPDIDPSDPIVTLAPGEGLALDTRTVVVHGVAAGIVQPVRSVSGLAGAPELPVSATVPILCGRVVRVN